MRRYVKNLSEYLTEALNKTEWLNYKNDTALNSPDPDTDISDTSALILRLMNMDNPADLLFTGDDVSIGEDYRYFIESILPKSEKVDEGIFPSTEYSAYYTLYKNGDRFFIKYDIKGTYEYSYVFINKNDYDYFDSLDQPMVPRPPEEPQVQATPAEEAPAQPAGAGATLV